MENMMNITTIPRYIPHGNVELITPEIAKEYLDQHNKMNPRKKINRPVVNSYAMDMKAGKWHLNGEPIVIDANGDIKNGQHRLLAVVAAGVPVYFYVVRGIDPEITTFDMPLNRKVSQELGIGTNFETLANMVVTDCYKIARVPKGIVKDYIIKHLDELRLAVNLSAAGVDSRKSIVGKKRDVYGAIYLLTRCGANPEEIRTFMAVVNSGFMLDSRESSSAVVLANFLRSDSQTARNKNKAMITMQFVVKAFRDFENGIARRNNYRVNNVSEVLDMLHRIRVEDGLSE